MMVKTLQDKRISIFIFVLTIVVCIVILWGFRDTDIETYLFAVGIILIISAIFVLEYQKSKGKRLYWRETTPTPKEMRKRRQLFLYLTIIMAIASLFIIISCILDYIGGETVEKV